MPCLSPRSCLNPAFIGGILLTAALAYGSSLLAGLPFFARAGLGPLTLAIMAGMLAGNMFFARLAPYSGKGVDFAKNKLLRLGIILYGFGITLQDIGGVGGRAVIIDLIMVVTVFFLGLWLGQNLFGLSAEDSIIISTGSAICGAAAVMATEPILKAPAAKVTVAVATVVVFGTISLFLYPLLYPLSGFTPRQFGIYLGSSVHEIAQVVAAGQAINEETAVTALITKMIRVMLLVPFLLLLSAWQAKYRAKKADRLPGSGITAPTDPRPARTAPGGRAAQTKILVPWFALFFVLASLLASLPIMPAALLTLLKTAGSLLLAMAMAALGLRSHYSALRQAGLKPLALAFMLFLFLILGGGLVNYTILKL